MKAKPVLMLVLAVLILSACSGKGSDNNALPATQTRSEEVSPQPNQTPADEEPSADQPQEPLTPLSVADTNVYFQSGLTTTGLATSMAQTLSGQLSDPDPNTAGFNGQASLSLNGRSITLSPYLSGSIWRFEQPLELDPGANSLSLTVHDGLNRLRSYNGPRQFFSAAANLPAANQYQVAIQTIDLSAYPTVNLSVTVQAGGEPIDGLASANFSIINAARPAALTGFSQTGQGHYNLSYTDHLAGSRKVYVYVALPTADQNPTWAGLSPAASYGRNFALLVGINDYPPQFNDLNNCVNDVYDMQALLTANSWGTGQIVRLTDGAATRTAVLNQLASFMNQLAPADALLFHYSGHGSGNPDDGESSQYICTAESEAQWISVTDLSNALDTSAKGFAPGIANIFVMLDSCHSGNFIAKTIELDQVAKYLPLPENLAGRGDNLNFSRDLSAISGANIFVMTACQGSEVAYDVGSLSNGAFTHYLTKSLGLIHASRTAECPASAPANLNRDPSVSGEEAYTWLLPWVSAYRQTPQLSDNTSLSPATLIMLY